MGKLASPNNPSADADGNVFVTPGKHIPGIPLHQIKSGVDYALTPALKLGTDVIWVSSQWYIGDQEELQSIYLDALHKLGKLLVAMGSFETAAEVYRLAAANGRHQRLVERCISLPDVARQDALACDRGERNAGQQADHNESEDQTT